MHRLYFLSIIFWLGSVIQANHFRGGTITWKPLNNNATIGSTISVMITQTYSWTKSQIGCNDSMIAIQWPPINLLGKAGTGMYLLCNASCSTSGGYVGNEVPITGYCTDYSTALDLTVSQRSDIVNLTVGAHFTATFGTNGGWQALALGSSAGWSLSNVIDLTPRSDNGLINTPPVATCLSYLSIPVNVQQIIQIPVLDADNDYLRCRFANGTSECLNTCPPGSLPSGTSLTSSCILTITGPTIGAYYLVAIQVEDFLSNTSLIPLSSVPLQFLIYVYDTPNCTLKPLLTSDLNNNQCQGVQVGVNFTMTLTAINRCNDERIIVDIATVSFPIIIKSALIQNTANTSLWSMQITWMPTINQVGSHVFCAVAADNDSVQSDQYCVTLFVGSNSIPLCPGVTTTTTSLPSSIVSSTASNHTIDWPLILGLSLGALLLAICCSLCCCYFLLAPVVYRRRQKKNKNSEDNFGWYHDNRNLYQKFSRSHNRKEHHQNEQQNSIISISPSWIPTTATVTKSNQRDVTSERVHSRIIVPLKQSRSCISDHKTRKRDKTLDPISQENITQISSTLHDYNDSLTVPLSVPITRTSRSKTVNVIKLRRFFKSSVAPQHFRSTSNVSVQWTKRLRNDLNNSRRIQTSARSISNVSVCKIKRSDASVIID